MSNHTAPVTTNPARNGLGIAAIILGLIGMLMGLVPLTGFVAVALGIAGLVLGLAGRSRVKRHQATNRKTSWAGIVTSLAAIALGIWGMTIVFGAFEDVDEGLTCLAEAETPAEMDACE